MSRSRGFTVACGLPSGFPVACGLTVACGFTVAAASQPPPPIHTAFHSRSGFTAAAALQAHACSGLSDEVEGKDGTKTGTPERREVKRRLSKDEKGGRRK